MGQEKRSHGQRRATLYVQTMRISVHRQVSKGQLSRVHARSPEPEKIALLSTTGLFFWHFYRTFVLFIIKNNYVCGHNCARADHRKGTGAPLSASLPRCAALAHPARGWGSLSAPCWGGLLRVAPNQTAAIEDSTCYGAPPAKPYLTAEKEARNVVPLKRRAPGAAAFPRDSLCPLGGV